MRRALSLTVVLILISLTGIQIDRTVAADDSKEFKSLFNGKNLDGWDGDSRYWSVENGVIIGRTSAEAPLEHNTFLIWKDGKLKDFELHVSYKIANGNSGIQYRSKDLGDHVVSGYQADIVGDTPDKYSGILYEEKGRGILAQRGEAVTVHDGKKKEVTGSVGDSDVILEGIKKGDWNEYVITARGNKLTHEINGQTTIEVIDEDTANAAREGILALQVHQGPPMVVQFKDIKLKALSE